MRKYTKIASFMIALALMVTSFATFFVKNDIHVHAAGTTPAVDTNWSLTTADFNSNYNGPFEFYLYNPQAKTFESPKLIPFVSTANGNNGAYSTTKSTSYGDVDNVNNVQLIRVDEGNPQGQNFKVFGRSNQVDLVVAVVFREPAAGTYSFKVNAARFYADSAENNFYSSIMVLAGAEEAAYTKTMVNDTDTVIENSVDLYAGECILFPFNPLDNPWADEYFRSSYDRCNGIPRIRYRSFQEETYRVK